MTTSYRLLLNLKSLTYLPSVCHSPLVPGIVDFPGFICLNIPHIARKSDSHPTLKYANYPTLKMQIISRLNLAEVEDVEMDKKVENAIYIHFNIRQNRLHDMELLLPPAVT